GRFYIKPSHVVFLTLACHASRAPRCSTRYREETHAKRYRTCVFHHLENLGLNASLAPATIFYLPCRSPSLSGHEAAERPRLHILVGSRAGRIGSNILRAR